MQLHRPQKKTRCKILFFLILFKEFISVVSIEFNNNFDTSIATNMNGMFWQSGVSSVTIGQC